MKKILLLLFLNFSFHAFGQIEFEPGYFITNDQRKMEVFILNREWRDNPTTFTYKTSLSEKAETASIEDVVEFGIGDYVKYKRFSAPIDRSGTQVSELSTKAGPEFEIRTVFLQQLVSGEADLYAYKQGSLDRFFIFTPATGLEPLVFKEYLKQNRIATNNHFRQQLYNLSFCEETSPDEIRNISYRRMDLIEYFETNNRCRGVGYHVYKEDGKKLEINLTVKAGLDFSNFAIEKGIYVRGAEIESKPSFRVGAEIEAVLPFNRNKWSIFVEPSYSRLYINREHLVSNPIYNKHEVDLTVDHKFITVLIGARHYFFINSSSKLFLSAGASFDNALESHVLIDRDERYELDPELSNPQTGAYFNLGVGYNYRGLSAEIRYNTPKKISGTGEVLTHYTLDWESKVKSLSVVLGYTIF